MNPTVFEISYGTTQDRIIASSMWVQYSVCASLVRNSKNKKDSKEIWNLEL